jgi:hypothetical protein
LLSGSSLLGISKLRSTLLHAQQLLPLSIVKVL